MLRKGFIGLPIGDTSPIYAGTISELSQDLREVIDRWNEFRLEFPTRFKTQDAYMTALRNYELNAVRIDSYNRLKEIKYLFDEELASGAKGINIVEIISKSTKNQTLDEYRRQENIRSISKLVNSDGERLIEKTKSLGNQISDLNIKKAVAQKSQLGFLRPIMGAKLATLGGIAAVVIGFGAIIHGSGLATQLLQGAPDGDDYHEDEWLALLESGQVDLITDFSSSFWTPDTTDHAAVPSVKELMIHLTLFQREIWYGEISDAPDVVNIVKHCLPQKSLLGGKIKAKCESVLGRI